MGGNVVNEEHRTEMVMFFLNRPHTLKKYFPLGNKLKRLKVKPMWPRSNDKE